MNASTRTPTVQSPGPAPHYRRRPASLLSDLSLRLAPALLAGALLAGPALATTGERPRPQDYPDYGSYVKALVDYQRAQATPPASKEKPKPRGGIDPSKLCREDGGSDEKKKQNSCEGKYLYIEDELEDNAKQDKPSVETEAQREQGESIEEAISRAGYEAAARQGDGVPDFRPNGLSLQEIPAEDLRESGVAGLLGLFDNVRMTNLGSSTALGGAYGLAGGSGGSATVDPDGTLRVSLENIILQLSTLDLDILANTVSFGDGYSIVDATVRIEGNGLAVGLSSQTYTPVYVVDRDGIPSPEWEGAGALTIDHMSILVPYVEANIQSVRTTGSDNSLLQIDTYSPGPIYVGLANTRVGVAPASRDGSWIGESTSFLEFGPSSVLTINAGTRVNVSLARPDGLNTAFVTLNGRIGDLSLESIGLVDHAAGDIMSIGKLAVRGLHLVDARIFLDEQKVVMDMGRGLTSVDVDIERVYLGGAGGGGYLGDFYARGARINSLRLTAEPH